jgi:hypothetical protein
VLSRKVCKGILPKKSRCLGYFTAAFVADLQQQSPKPASTARQPYAAAMASHMVVGGLGQMDWDFQ